MVQDTDVLLEATMALVPPLLTALDALAHAGRHLHPQSLAHLVPQIDAFAEPLRQGMRRFTARAMKRRVCKVGPSSV